MAIVKNKQTPVEEAPEEQLPVEVPTEMPIERAIGLDFDSMSENIPQLVVAEDLTPWLNESAWPQPKWFTKRREDGRVIDKNYEVYVMNSLRWRYTRLEGDFRTVLNNYFNTPYVDKVTARRIIAFLESARGALEKDNCDPLDVSNLLDMADQYMVWLYPPHVAAAQAAALSSQLKSENNVWGTYLEGEMNKAGQTLGGLRAALDKVKQVLNTENEIVQVNNGLQIERLEMLIKGGALVLLGMVLGLPLILKMDAAIFKESMLGNPFIASFKEWIGLFTIGLIGAVGAFLSGLLQVRRTRVTIGEFKDSVMQFKLRPIVGAIFAMMISALLTWDIISGVEIKNAGAYILIAFLCGFSERFFLSLLNIDEEGNVTKTPTPSSQPAQSPVVTSPTAVDGTSEPANVNEVPLNQ